jgi:hypothetical protein
MRLWNLVSSILGEVISLWRGKLVGEIYSLARFTKWFRERSPDAINDRAARG